MHKKKSKLRERTQLVFIYSLMILTIVSVLAILVLVLQGYRYNRFDGKVEQGGLVQFDSQPTGAAVTVDGIKLANKTASKITLTSGAHTVTMSRAGYNDWKKSVTVQPGAILWLDYTRLFPTDPKVTTVAQSPAVSSALQSPDRNWEVYMTAPTAPTFSLVRLDTDSPKVTTIELPATDYTVATDLKTQRFSLESWDKDSQEVLVRHDYDAKTEFLVVNVRGDGSVYDITTKLGVTATKVQFAEGDSKVVYLLTDAHELRRANIGSTTLSGPLAGNVSDFAAKGQTVITYETLADANGRRSVGYVSPGNNIAKTIASYAIGNDVALQSATGTYYGDRYIVIAHGPQIDISTGSLPSSDSKDAISRKSIAQVALGAGPSSIGFSPEDSRIVYAQYGEKIMTYDLELTTSASVTLPSALTHEVTWIDGFHIATTNGSASYYDYDGTNGQLVSPQAADLPLAVSSDNKYLYYFATDGTNVTLSRVQMTGFN